MLTPEQRDLLQRHVSIDGDGNVVGNDNTVRVTKQTAADYTVQIGEQRITVTIAELYRVLHIKHSQVGIVGDHAHVDEIHFHRHVIIYDGVKPVSAGALLDACQAQVASILYDARHKYDSKLYVNRAIERDLCAFFDTPLDGPAPNCFLIVAPAGSGKTNLLCDLARVRVSHQPVLLLMGGSTYLSGTTGLLGAVKEELETASSQVAFRSAGDSLHTLHRLAREMERDALLFLDAINEHDRPAAMRQALEDLLRKTRDRRVKLVVTCRDYYWGLFKGRFWEGATVNSLPTEGDVDGDDTGAEEDDFSRFATDEHERALDLYLEHYAIGGRPVGDAAEQCRHPLLLRFFCEAYRGQDVGQAEDIRLKELFDRYWDQKLASIADRMIKQGDERLQAGLAEEVGGYLLNVAAYMLHDNVRAVPLNEMSRATQRTEQYDDPRSVYGRIRDEFIILEEKERGKGQRKELQVAFVYEEFMEYVMARSLMRDWDQAGLDKAAILGEIEALTAKYESFAQILGVMVYLALMLKEERGLPLWSLLLNQGERWQKVVFEAFRKLPEDQLNSDVFDVLAELLDSGNASYQIQVLDTLKMRRVGQAAPVSMVETLDRLRISKKSIARRAVLVLGNIVPDLAIPVLAKAVNDTRKDIRKNAITVLGKLKDVRAVEPLIAAFKDSNDDMRSRVTDELMKLVNLGDVVFEPLVAALKDNNSGMQLGAASALIELGDVRAVEPLIDALVDSNQQVRSKAALALGKVGDARAIGPLMDALKDKSWPVRRRAALSLGELGGVGAVEPLIGLLNDSDYRVRSGAAEALGKLGDTRAVEFLITTFNDDNALVRRRTAASLGELGDVRAMEPLTAGLKDSDENVQSEAAEALGKLGDARAVEPLIGALSDRDERVRAKAIVALSRLGEPALKYLIAGLKHGNWRVRKGAAEALGELGDAQAVEPLIVALKDSSKNVRSRAARALRCIGTPEARAALREHKGG